MRDAKVAHDWGSNNINIQGNGIVKTIIVTKHLVGEVRKSKVLLCYDYQNGTTMKKMPFTIELELFSIGSISLLETIQSGEYHRYGNHGY